MRIAGKQDGPGLIIYGPPRAPRIAKDAHFCILWPIYEQLAVIFSPCYMYVCFAVRSYCPEIFVHLGSTYEKKVYFFHILGLNMKISYPIVSLFDMYIDMDERIAGEQNMPSLIIEGPPQGPLNSPKYFFFYILAHV